VQQRLRLHTNLVMNKHSISLVVSRVGWHDRNPQQTQTSESFLFFFSCFLFFIRLFVEFCAIKEEYRRKKEREEAKINSLISSFFPPFFEYYFG